MPVCDWSRAAIWLSCSGERCVTTTNAIPESEGIASKKRCKAISDPADPAMPTMAGPLAVGTVSLAVFVGVGLETALDLGLFLVVKEAFLEAIGIANDPLANASTQISLYVIRIIPPLRHGYNLNRLRPRVKHRAGLPSAS